MSKVAITLERFSDARRVKIRMCVKEQEHFRFLPSFASARATKIPTGPERHRKIITRK